MNAWLPILRLARNSLIMLAAVAILCGAAVYGLDQWANNLRRDLGNQQGSLQVQQALLDTRRADLSNVRAHIEAYEKLRAQGLVGNAERAQWVEQLQATFEQLGLPGKIGLQLQAAKPLALPPDPAANPAAAPITPLSHDLLFEIRQVHEEELLALLQDFRDTVRARFRVDSCHLRDPAGSGLTASCTLRFVSIPVTIPVPPSAAVPAAAPTP